MRHVFRINSKITLVVVASHDSASHFWLYRVKKKYALCSTCLQSLGCIGLNNSIILFISINSRLEQRCIVGGVDSLLSADTLAWLASDWRLVSESHGRQHGLFPSHGAGFFMVETEQGAEKRCRQPLARIIGHSLTTEPAPFVSELPCKGDGLTRAIRNVLEHNNTPPSAIDSIFCDLNGEHHRFKEWGFADIRCFPHNSPQLFHPSDGMGDVGAAWVPVLAGIATQGFKRGMLGEKVMIVCSDDHGERGAMILCPYSK